MRFVLPLLALALIAPQAVAQTTTLTLDQAVQLARRNNPAFQATVNSRRAADLNVKAAYAQLIPRLDAQASGRFTEGGQQFVNGIPISNSSDILQSNYGLGVSYTVNSAVLFAPKLYSAQRDAAEADVVGAQEIMRATITQQYLAVLRAQSNAALQDTLVATAQGQLDLATARQSVGAATILDVRTAEVALGRAQIAALQAKNAAEVQMLRLFEQMGVPQPPNVELTTRFPVAQVQFNVDSLKRLARSVNPGLVALRSRESAAVAGVRAQRGQYLPSLSLSTGWGWNGSRFTNTDALIERAQLGQLANFGECATLDSLRTGAGMPGLSCNTLFPTPLPQSAIDNIRSSNQSLDFTKAPQSFSAFVSIPIFDNLNREVRLQQANIDRDNARFAVRGREVRLDADVTEAYLNLVTAIRTVELNDINAAAAREQLAFAEERYRVGAATFLDVTTSRGTFEQAQIDRLNAVYEYHRAFAALESAVGRPLR